MLPAFVCINRLCYNSIVTVSLSKLLRASLIVLLLSTQGLLTHPVTLSSKYMHISTTYCLHWNHSGLKSHYLPHGKIEIPSNQCPLQSLLPPPAPHNSLLDRAATTITLQPKSVNTTLVFKNLQRLLSHPDFT